MATVHDRSEAARYLARPGRLAVVVEDLAELRGPTTGVVELPHRLVWQPHRTFDLEKPVYLRWLHEIVLREAAHPDELRTWLDADTLVRVWPDLYLPRGVRRAWEERHPSLRSNEAAA